VTVRGAAEILVEPYDPSTADAVLRAVRKESELVGLGHATLIAGPSLSAPCLYPRGSGGGYTPKKVLFFLLTFFFFFFFFFFIFSIPAPDSQLVRVPVPPPTPESRALQQRRLASLCEDARQSLRRARRAALDAVAVTEAEEGKDEAKRLEKLVSAAVDTVQAEIASVESAKAAEIGDGAGDGDAAAGGGKGKKKGRKGKK
jgi:hypothetical protein